MEVKIHDSSTLTSAPSGCEKMMDSKQEEGATEQQEQSVDTSIRIANQINHDLPQANHTHSAVGLQEQDICWLCCSTGGQVCYYGAVSIIGIVLVWAAVLFLMGIHSFLTGDFCVDSGDAYDSTPLIEMGHAFTRLGHMFGFMGAIAALILLVLWNPPLVQTIITEEHHDAEVSGDLIRPSFECVSAGLLIDGILIMLIGLSKKKGYKDMDEPTMPAWVWSVPFFLVGISMFAIFAILMIR